MRNKNVNFYNCQMQIFKTFPKTGLQQMHLMTDILCYMFLIKQKKQTEDQTSSLNFGAEMLIKKVTFFVCS